MHLQTEMKIWEDAGSTGLWSQSIRREREGEGERRFSEPSNGPTVPDSPSLRLPLRVPIFRGATWLICILMAAPNERQDDLRGEGGGRGKFIEGDGRLSGSGKLSGER